MEGLGNPVHSVRNIYFVGCFMICQMFLNAFDASYKSALSCWSFGRKLREHFVFLEFWTQTLKTLRLLRALGANSKNTLCVSEFRMQTLKTALVLGLGFVLVLVFVLVSVFVLVLVFVLVFVLVLLL